MRSLAFGVVFLASSPAALASVSYTSYSEGVDKEIIYLDRHYPNCNPGTAMTQWKVQSDGGSNVRIQYTCDASFGVTISLSATEQYTSASSNGKLEFLDRHAVDCNDFLGSGQQGIVQGWGGSNSGGNFRYAYRCQQATAAYGKRTLYTGCDTIDNRGLEYLDRHDLACGNGEALSYFRLTRSGCSGDQQQFSYECVSNVAPPPPSPPSPPPPSSPPPSPPPPLSPPSTPQYNMYTDWAPWEDQSILFLDRHDVACDGEDAITDFLFQRNQQDLSEGRIAYECDPVFHLTGSKYTYSTAADVDGTLQYLDRHVIDCDSLDEGGVQGQGVIVGFVGVNDNWDFKYQYDCKFVNHYVSKRTVSSLCEEVQDKGLEYLDRHSIECNAGEALSSWKLTPVGCSNQEQRFEWKCVSAVAPPPSVAWPPVSTPSPPPASDPAPTC